jgi:prolyl-tRNA synthetase
MKASLYHYKTLRDSPSEAELTSHKLMIKANMIKPIASGIYTWLPLGTLILKKVENIVRAELNKGGCLEIIMPLVQPKDLWDESGRSKEYGPELLGFKDRNQRDFFLGPTHEEIITDIAKKEITSHKDLPKTFYQIQNKFRDEIRPRFGVMRAREFLMKDAYSFSLDEDSMHHIYSNMKEIYKNIFDLIGLDYKIVSADSGSIGGDKSEEFHVLANSGEDTLAFSNESDFAINIELLDEKDPDKIEGMKSPDGKGKLSLKKGIEVGHIFELGTKYSKAMNLKVQKDNKLQDVFMGCYGIGVSRIVAAAIEQNFDDEGIIFPKAISPFNCYIVSINPKSNKDLTIKVDKIYSKLIKCGIEVFLDDRDLNPGIKFRDANLMGVPFQLVISDKINNDSVELINRKNQKKEILKIDQIIDRIK